MSAENPYKPEKVYDRHHPDRIGVVDDHHGMNYYVLWNDGKQGWVHIDELGHVPTDYDESQQG